MTIRVYDIGDRPTITATFTNAADALTDPSTVQFKWKTPAGIETTITSPDATIANPSVGIWTYTPAAALSESGRYIARAKGTAGLITAGELSFTVQTTQFVTP